MMMNHLTSYGEGQRKHLFTTIKIFTLDLLALLYTFAIHYDAVLQGTFVIDTCVTGREEQQTISANQCFKQFAHKQVILQFVTSSHIMVVLDNTVLIAVRNHVTELTPKRM